MKRMLSLVLTLMVLFRIDGGQSQDIFQCPTTEEKLYAHPHNCHQFYSCGIGVKALMNCPSGLVFNVEKQYCDWPANVKCSSDDVREPKHQKSEWEDIPEDDINRTTESSEDNCRLPDCRWGGSDIPGTLAVSEIPNIYGINTV